jgi:hypothetical protein
MERLLDPSRAFMKALGVNEVMSAQAEAGDGAVSALRFLLVSEIHGDGQRC